jgi:hypothetical protein
LAQLLDGEGATLAKQALPFNEQGEFVLRRMLREMLRHLLRVMLRSVANAGASAVASRVANHVALSGDNIVAHSRGNRVNQPIIRQTSSLSTA